MPHSSCFCRYGIEGLVYLRKKSGLVATPITGGGVGYDEGRSSVVIMCATGTSSFPSGTITSTEHTITVTHSHGHYTLSLFDHLLVHVRVEPSHAHLPYLNLELLRCEPFSSYSSSSSSTTTIASSTTSSCRQQDKTAIVPVDTGGEFVQQRHTLYTLVERMKRLGQTLPAKA